MHPHLSVPQGALPTSGTVSLPSTVTSKALREPDYRKLTQENTTPHQLEATTGSLAILGVSSRTPVDTKTHRCPSPQCRQHVQKVEYNLCLHR